MVNLDPKTNTKDNMKLQGKVKSFNLGRLEKKRRFREEEMRVVDLEVKKLVEAGFIWEVTYITWLTT